MLIFTLAVIFLIYGVFEGYYGFTPGKYFLRLRTVDKNGNKLTITQGIIRNYFRFIDGIAFYVVALIIMLFNKQRKRLGDFLAETVVVYEQK
ncbi:MAG: RDD family protein [Francisellaceae bacterium]